MVNVIRGISSKTAMIALVSFTTGYVVVRFIGVFSPAPPSLLRILHELPALAALLPLLISAIGRFKAGSEREVRLFFAGFILTVVGILWSSQTRFEGRVVLAESQSFKGSAGEYIGGTVYMGMRAAYPPVSIDMLEVSPSFMKGGKKAWNIPADVMCSTGGSGRKMPMRLNSLAPAFAGGMLLRTRTMGYAPHVRIYDPEGRIIDEGTPILRLFPPGREDYFRFDLAPETFYLKYFPDRSLIGDRQPASSQEGKSPLYKLRVARNLDLIFNQYIEPYNITLIDKIYISIEDVYKWTEIEIVKDYGLFLIFPGLGIMIFSAVKAGFKGYRVADFL